MTQALIAAEMEREHRRAVVAGLRAGCLLGLAIGAILLLAGCGPSTKLPPLPTPGPDYCILYRAFNYAPAAATAENVETLKKHIANETDFMRDCLGDRSRSLGPR